MVKDVGELCRTACRQGWTVKIGGSGHVRFQAPDGKGPLVVGSCTPSDGRFGVRKLRHDLRRAGLALP
jgi:hypothetical protein